MSVSTYIDPRDGTSPAGYVNPGGGSDPFVILRLDGLLGRAHLSLGQMAPSDQAAYLEALQAVCADLLTQIRQAALLTAVEATPHDPQAAAQIRASAADEAATS